jgi:uncharacterized protein (TIGR02996 family)
MTRTERLAREHSFLLEAKGQPEEDGLRLVLADWLEDVGDFERAEFLRLQCHLAAGSSEPVPGGQREAAPQREAELLLHHGGAWLGPLWQHGGLWHRGLLSLRLDRRADLAPLQDLLPWIDGLHFDVSGREALRGVCEVLDAWALNHVTLALLRPFRPEELLAALASVGLRPCLRTLTLRWPPGLGRRDGDRSVPLFDADFFGHLSGALPLTCRLTHLGSSLPWPPTRSRRSVPAASRRSGRRAATTGGRPCPHASSGAAWPSDHTRHEPPSGPRPARGAASSSPLWRAAT